MTEGEHTPTDIESRPAYELLADYEIINGIDDGTITDPEALHVYIRKSLDAVRGVYHGEELQKQQADHAGLVYGEPRELVSFSLSHANEYMAFDYPTASGNPANYDIAARWYNMAARVAQPAGESGPGPEQLPVAQLQELSADEIGQAIDTGAATDVQAVHTYIRKSLERDRRQYHGQQLQEREAQYAELVFGDPKHMTRYCVQQASSRMPSRQGLNVEPGTPAAASRWYAMAGRFAGQAASERRSQLQGGS